jgi:hypothetical protein
VTRCTVGRHREAEANRITALLAVPCVLALIGGIWPAAGVVIGCAVAVMFGGAVVVGGLVVVARRSAIRRRVDRELVRSSR